MTPVEFLALSDRYRESFESKYLLPVLQVAIVADFFARCAYGMKTEPKMFIPDLKREAVEPDPVASSMALMSNWDAFAAHENSKKK